MTFDDTQISPPVDSAEPKANSEKILQIVALVLTAVILFCGGFMLGKFLPGGTGGTESKNADKTTDEAMDGSTDENPDGAFQGELEQILEISPWDVQTLVAKDGEVIFESNGENHVTDDQFEGFDQLIGLLSMVGYERRDLSTGSTAQQRYEITLKNGDRYEIILIGNQHKVTITYPDGEERYYYGYQ